MTKYDLGEVVAERKLSLVSNDAATVPCLVRVGKPVQVDDDTWICPYRIEAGDRIRTLGMHGIDSMQALVLTMKTLDVEIEFVAKLLDASVQYLEGSHDSVFNP
jgi:hypothetical protein